MGDVGRAACGVATGGRRGVGTGVGRGWAFRQRLWHGKDFLRKRLTKCIRNQINYDILNESNFVRNKHTFTGIS